MVALNRWLPLVVVLAAPAVAAQLLDRVLVIVENDVITQSELQDRVLIVAKQIEQGGTPLPPREQLVSQVLEYMIAGRLQLQRAQQRNLTLPPGAVAQEFQALAQRNGMPAEQFERQLERSGINIEAFRGYLHEQMLTQQLQQLEARGLVRVTEDEVDNFLRLHADRLQTATRYRLRHILLAVSGRASTREQDRIKEKAWALAEKVRAGTPFASLAVTESDGRAALEGGHLGWRSEAELPGFASAAIVTLVPGDVTDPQRSPSGYHLFYLEEKEGGETVMVNQTHARHILIKTNAMIDDAEARARLETLKDRIEGGDQFEDLARSHSDDTASAVDGGDLDWISPGILDPTFEEQMGRLGVNEVSAPFKTQFGWHIVQVLERRRTDETASALRARALNHLARSRVNDEIEIWLRRLVNSAYIQYMLEPS